MEYQRAVVTGPPQFRQTQFEASVIKLQSNTNGDWIVTLKVPSTHREQATTLGDAYGLGLNVAITRKQYGG